MNDSATPSRSRWRGRLIYGATILVTAATTYAVVALLMNISERKEEAKQHYLKLVELNEGHPYTYDRDALVKMLDEALATSRPRRH